MSLAICISCGSTKNAPSRRCGACGFLPVSDEDKAKSVIVSLDYEIGGNYRGKTRDELLRIATSLRDKSYTFDPEEVANVVRNAKEVKSIPAAVLALDLIKWLALPLVILIGIAYLLWATR